MRKLVIKAIKIGRLETPGHAVFDGYQEVSRHADGQLGLAGRDSLANARASALDMIEREPGYEHYTIEVVS